ncbi:hypothetical protein PENARI_c043G00917 [Penicillium arizonense]|uniref:Uncharacterized protein n=1 Tax=Penicillium arizonense TaxID=1835702 RepID=A0A1F5L2R1_PENAI|nr:hypothetical protein PENARI_c043G00917 [Penicillium arizonense]OGE47494.1 hypothetical protein PENARI_c043G00917 [Penicillium arizonense]
MDAPNSSPDQEKKETGSQENSDHAPPLLSRSQQEAEKRHTLVTEPLQPILKVLADLERDDPKFAFPVGRRLVALYRRLWESCVSRHIDGRKLERGNQILKEAGNTPEQKEGRSSASPR